MSVTTERLSGLRKLAYAQAGRAVLCVLHRRGFRSVSVVAEGRTGGRLVLVPLTLEDRRTGTPDQARIEREIVIDLAGPIAVRIANRREKWRGTGRDLLNAGRAIDLAARVTSSHEAARAYLKSLWLRARDTLAEPAHWRAVQQVAAELVDRRRLSAHAVRRIVRAAAP